MIKILTIFFLITAAFAESLQHGKLSIENYIPQQTGIVNINSGATVEVVFDYAFDTTELSIVLYLDKSLASRHASDIIQYGNLTATGFKVAIWYEFLGLFGTKTTGIVHWIVSEKSNN